MIDQPSLHVYACMMLHSFSVVRRALPIILLLLVTAVPAWAVELSMPIDCDYGNDCFIQNYVDLDPSKNWQDYQCGYLSYDGHKGSDFRISWDDYQRGVNVLAAADGVVFRVRDGMEDRDVTGRKESVKGVEAGNAVVIRHKNGLMTIYAHMKNGSVLVHPGDKVKRGQPLGLVGLSGMTAFPHLHFGIRSKTAVVCPFKGTPNPNKNECGPTPASLWSKQALTKIKYIPTGLLQAGFTDYRPALPDILRTKQKNTLSTKARLLLFSVTAFGVRSGDNVRMRILDPNGQTFAKSNTPFNKNQAQRMVYVGRKLGNKLHWVPGKYQGKYQLIRDGKVILDVKRSILVR